MEKQYTVNGWTSRPLSDVLDYIGPSDHDEKKDIVTLEVGQTTYVNNIEITRVS